MAAGAVALVLAVGLAIALAGGSDEADGPQRAFGPVEVVGDALPPFTATDGDPALGRPVPRLDGIALDGSGVDLAAGEPTLVAFLAHWCPHCRAELPRLVDAAADGGFDGIRTVAVLTGSNPAAPNFPPGAWLEREGWEGDTLLDDEAASAAQAYGLAGYPFLVALDADGNVVARTSGELEPEQLTALAEAARSAG
jgi:thiol-disulfide isomerase/thioredoxin